MCTTLPSELRMNQASEILPPALLVRAKALYLKAGSGAQMYLKALYLKGGGLTLWASLMTLSATLNRPPGRLHRLRAP